MRAPAFWWRRAGAIAAILSPAARLYAAAAERRLRRPGTTVGIPIICIGDLTVGGAGKTPTALAAARLLQQIGCKPFFLTRGYRGRLSGPLLVEPRIHRAGDVGDEPLLLSRCAPTVVARDRVAGARLARERGAEAVVMDDGFQNPALAKDCAVLVVDAAWGVGNGRVLPAGPLRAPLEAQVARAQAVVAIGGGEGAKPLLEAAARRGIPIFRAGIAPAPESLAAIGRRPVLAFAGIGHPEKFYATLAAAGVDLRLRRSFPDHHVYSAKDAAALLHDAEARGLGLVTTEKDFVRLDADGPAGALGRQATALSVRLAFENEASFADLLRRAITSYA